MVWRHRNSRSTRSRDARSHCAACRLGKVVHVDLTQGPSGHRRLGGSRTSTRSHTKSTACARSCWFTERAASGWFSLSAHCSYLRTTSYAAREFIHGSSSKHCAHFEGRFGRLPYALIWLNDRGGAIG